MPASVGAGGVFKSVTDIRVGAGGAWKAVTGAWVGAGGVWWPWYGSYIATLTPALNAGNIGFSSSPLAYGSLSSVSPSPGLNIIQLRDVPSVTELAFRFTRASDPGASFFTQMTIGSAVFLFSAASYSYSIGSGQGQWTWHSLAGMTAGVPVTVTVW